MLDRLRKGKRKLKQAEDKLRKLELEEDSKVKAVCTKLQAIIEEKQAILAALELISKKIDYFGKKLDELDEEAKRINSDTSLSDPEKAAQRQVLIQRRTGYLQAIEALKEQIPEEVEAKLAHFDVHIERLFIVLSNAEKYILEHGKDGLEALQIDVNAISATTAGFQDSLSIASDMGKFYKAFHGGGDSSTGAQATSAAFDLAHGHVGDALKDAQGLVKDVANFAIDEVQEGAHQAKKVGHQLSSWWHRKQYDHDWIGNINRFFTGGSAAYQILEEGFRNNPYHSPFLDANKYLHVSKQGLDDDLLAQDDAKLRLHFLRDTGSFVYEPLTLDFGHPGLNFAHCFSEQL